MAKVMVMNHVTLDGVMQAPGRPDEDTREGFEHGGWAIAGNDEVMRRKMGEGGMGKGGALLTLSSDGSGVTSAGKLVHNPVASPATAPSNTTSVVAPGAAADGIEYVTGTGGAAGFLAAYTVCVARQKKT